MRHALSVLFSIHPSYSVSLMIRGIRALHHLQLSQVLRRILLLLLGPPRRLRRAQLMRQTH